MGVLYEGFENEYNTHNTNSNMQSSSTLKHNKNNNMLVPVVTQHFNSLNVCCLKLLMIIFTLVLHKHSFQNKS